ncbi:hypothetical protein Y1Q_0005177 [Alligator mississippiensis]|uniref:Uncharacterized protein n=1 Tax=Alligator mississippiensis TaxID=8496 RepID=A0A151MSX1_ALLMI|nr:hypothetical protein Y1Q_0005177 [Alligator mississippiensis]
MQREMKAWTPRSQEAGTNQAGEQKEMLQKLEVSRSLIGVLQKEVRSQEDRIEGLQDEVEDWQQKCIRSEQLAQELRDKLLDNHAQTEENGKVIAREMEKVIPYVANYEVLRDQKLSLERELEARTRENDRLQSQLQRMKAEKDHLGEQVQRLKTLLEDSVAKEAVTNTKREQSQLQMQALRQQLQALEAENKMIRAASGQMATKGQDPGESEVPEITSTATQTEVGPKAQVVEFVEAIQERLEMLRAQLEEHVMTAKSECLEQHHQLEGVKGSLREMEDQLTTKKLGGWKSPEQMKFPGDGGLVDLREEAEPGQPERSNPEKESLGVKPTALQEEVLPALLECWNKKWDQWLERHAEEMSRKRQQLGECCKSQAKQGITVPSQRPLVEAALIEVGTSGKGEQAGSRRETNSLVCQVCTQERQGIR